MEIITLQNPKMTAGKAILVTTGALLAVVGVLMMLTIILILPGIGTFLTGFLIVWFGRPKETIECRSCRGEVTARQGDKQAKCEHCDTVHPIKWTKINRKQPA